MGKEKRVFGYLRVGNASQLREDPKLVLQKEIEKSGKYVKKAAELKTEKGL